MNDLPRTVAAVGSFLPRTIREKYKYSPPSRWQAIAEEGRRISNYLIYLQMLTYLLQSPQMHQ